LKTTTSQISKYRQDLEENVPRRQVNLPLIAGIILVSIITTLAIIGPNIAPNDPNEEHTIILIEEQWYVPPFDMGTPGYPLGSDSFGRDLYSRLLWAIRPTMIMVVIVALVRLILGVVIGLSAGWFVGKAGRFLNGLIQIALAVPVLLVALGAIAIFGVEFGIWAFIIGLSLTGWVDTALQVREQTRIVKGQVYVEAANALGASNEQILSNHILKQITPMLLMLFAFEISSTLMLTAGLGFLGYYIGGDVWVDVDDFVARRISGNPELGQMLATSWVTLTKPWALVAVGSTVFLTVLGFNLIGEGLRQNIGLTKVQRRSSFSEIRNQIGLWMDDEIFHPVIQFFRIKPLRLGLTVVGLFFILSFGALLMLDAAAQTDVSDVLVYDDLKSQQTQDISQSSVVSSTNEVSNEVSPNPIITYNPSIMWEFIDESGFSGGPTLSSNKEQLYFVSRAGKVYASKLDGELIWQVDLNTGGQGTPLIDDHQNLIIAEESGGLTKLSPQGEMIWHFQTEAGNHSHSGPAIGPDGTIYYTVGTNSKGYVQAVSPNGEGLWVAKADTGLFFETPIPSPDGGYVFLRNDIFNTEDGKLIDYEFDLDVRWFFSGDDGSNYLLAGHKIIQWDLKDNLIEAIDVSEWDSSAISDFWSPSNVGVNSEGDSWQLYTTPGGDTSVFWVSADDQFYGASNVGISAGTLIALPDDLYTLVCGGGPFKPISTDCAYLHPVLNEPIWKFHLGNYGPVTGGVIQEESYFITTEEGYVFEINANSQQIVSDGDTEISPATIGEPGVIWTYKASGEFSSGRRIEADGYVFLTTDDDYIHILNPEGELINAFQMPAKPYHHASQTGRSAPLHISPEILLDGTIIMVSNDQRVIAINKEGKTLWEEVLVAEPAEHPIVDENGNFYLLDLNAGLNSFNKDGFNWRFESEAADIPAHGFTIGPDGTIYYVVTNYSKAYIEAVSPAGIGLWTVKTTTRDFYDELHISSDGRFLSVAENLFDTHGGELIEYDPGDKINEYIFGGNGHNFMRSLHTVREWQLSPAGIEILSEGIVSEEDTILKPPLGSSVDANGNVWLYYPERNIGGDIIIVWISSSGDLLGRHLLERNQHTIFDFDMDNSLLTECTVFDDTRTLQCMAYSPISDEPIWQILLNDIPLFQSGYIDDGIAYLFDEENVITAVYIGSQQTSSTE
jgi:ABC-type dipeptide/oligopeptide/nickel transport system permease subunit/sugar lactone lactonase YvrE